MNILIKNINTITCDDSAKYIESANIGIKDGIIDFVESNGSCPEGFTPDRVIDGKGKLLMPGLVNAHTHCAMTILRNFGDDLALEDWLFNRIFPAEAKLSEEDIYWGTMLGIGEMIKSGTTAFADMYLFMDYVAEAVKNTGMRANLSISPLKLNSVERSKVLDQAQECIEYYKRWNGECNGRIKVYIEVHSAYLFNEESLREAALLAKQLNTGIQIHVLETEKERNDSIKRYGENSAEVCAKCGIFDVPVIAAHCVHLSNDDIKLLKEKGINVAHNPTSNLKLGSGIARVPELIDAGINVCLGTDGTASNNNLNMIEEMNLAALIHKGVKMNPLLVNAEQAIKMGTINGSRAIGFGDSTGVIKKGMKADIIILNTDKLHFSPMNNPMSAVVYVAQGADVETVIVDGNILMENRELKTIDEEKVKYKVKEISKGLA